MKTWKLDRKIGNLSEKFRTVPSEGIRIDFDSFPEPERLLLRKVWEIEEKYGGSPPADVIEANAEFIFKAREVVGWRVLQLFMFVMKELLGADEIEEWYFKLHFYNFFEDLKECLERVRNWSKKDREEFLKDMNENGMMNKVFRIPRGFNEHNMAEGENKKEEVGDGKS